MANFGSIKRAEKSRVLEKRKLNHQGGKLQQIAYIQDLSWGGGGGKLEGNRRPRKLAGGIKFNFWDPEPKKNTLLTLKKKGESGLILEKKNIEKDGV